jgi:phosphohistidine phosphatase SixA
MIRRSRNTSTQGKKIQMIFKGKRTRDSLRHVITFENMVLQEPTPGREAATLLMPVTPSSTPSGSERSGSEPLEPAEEPPAESLHGTSDGDGESGDGQDEEPEQEEEDDMSSVLIEEDLLVQRCREAGVSNPEVVVRSMCKLLYERLSDEMLATVHARRREADPEYQSHLAGPIFGLTVKQLQRIYEHHRRRLRNENVNTQVYLTLMVHGDTDQSNKTGMAGDPNRPLTPEGILQVTRTAWALRSRSEFTPQLLITSPDGCCVESCERYRLVCTDPVEEQEQRKGTRRKSKMAVDLSRMDEMMDDVAFVSRAPSKQQAGSRMASRAGSKLVSDFQSQLESRFGTKSKVSIGGGLRNASKQLWESERSDFQSQLESRFGMKSKLSSVGASRNASKQECSRSASKTFSRARSKVIEEPEPDPDDSAQPSQSSRRRVAPKARPLGSLSFPGEHDYLGPQSYRIFESISSSMSEWDSWCSSLADEPRPDDPVPAMLVGNATVMETVIAMLNAGGRVMNDRGGRLGGGCRMIGGDAIIMKSPPLRMLKGAEFSPSERWAFNRELWEEAFRRPNWTVVQHIRGSGKPSERPAVLTVQGYISAEEFESREAIKETMLQVQKARKCLYEVDEEVDEINGDDDDDDADAEQGEDGGDDDAERAGSKLIAPSQQVVVEEDDSDRPPCTTCDSSGYIWSTMKVGPTVIGGTLVPFPCEDCEGTGLVPRVLTKKVNMNEVSDFGREWRRYVGEPLVFSQSEFSRLVLRAGNPTLPVAPHTLAAVREVVNDYQIPTDIDL